MLVHEEQHFKGILIPWEFVHAYNVFRSYSVPYPCPNFSHILPFLTPPSLPSFMSSSFNNSPSLICAACVRSGVRPSARAWLTALIKKSNLASPKHPLTANGFLTKLGHCWATPLHAGVLTGLSCCSSCKGNGDDCWEVRRTENLPCPQVTHLLRPSDSTLVIFLSPLSEWSLTHRRRGYNRDVLFRVEYSWGTYSRHFDRFWSFVLPACWLSQKGAYLMRTGAALTYGNRDTDWESSPILFSFSKTTLVGSPRAYELPNHEFLLRLTGQDTSFFPSSGPRSSQKRVH